MFVLTLLAGGCDLTGDEFRPAITGVPAVIDLGVLEVVTEDQRREDPTTIPEAIHYGQLGAPENVGIYGGATFQFRGTGGPVCVVTDPEAVFWNRSVSTQTETGNFKYQDIYGDDGDVDLSVGLSAYYTGSPGVEIGSFEANYTDPTGYDHTLEFNECVQVGIFGDTDVHSGRATVEYCDVNTDQKAGILYTVLLETFRLPTDDSILNYGTAVYEGDCASLGVNECTLPNEVGNADPNGLPESKAWFPDFEQDFCIGVARTNAFCAAGFEDYPDNPPCIDPDPTDDDTEE